MTATTLAGRYELSEVIGSGATGAVHRGRCLRTNEAIAIKVFRASPLASRAFRNEVRLISSLRHEGIPTIQDSGETDGCLWYTTPFQSGGTLRAVLPRIEGPRALPSLQEAFRHVANLCDVLGFIHREGIVHRDVKPENVLVSRDGRVTLVDFGLSTVFPGKVGSEQLESDTQTAGTVPYMAPEVIRGDFVDARADLYSLGCILYEVSVGTLPFSGSRQQVLDGHLERSAQPLAAISSEIPRELSELVASLLAKSPKARPASAEVVATSLRRILRIQADAEPGFRHAARLYRPRFVGREAELSTAERSMLLARRGQGSLIALLAPAGMGKTRLLMEICKRAERERLWVFRSRCERTNALTGQAGSALAAFRPILQTLLSRCRERGPEEMERLFAGKVRALVAVEPGLADIAEPAGEKRVPQAGSGVRLELFAALKQALTAAVRIDPILLVIDDAHRADELTIAFVEFLLATHVLDRMPLVVCLGARTEELTPELSKLVEQPGVNCSSLRGLDAREVRQTVEDLLNDPGPDQLQQHLELHGQGNPFFITEILRAALTSQQLERDTNGCWSLRGEDGSAALPTRLDHILERRLARLSVGARALAELVAAAGADLDYETACALLDVDDPALSASIRELGDEDVMESDGTSLRFVHDKLAEAVYAKLSPERRAELHLCLAARLARDDAEPARLAYHYLRGERPERALGFLTLAAESALSRYANREAAVHLRLALELADTGVASEEDRARWRRCLGDATLAMGLVGDARGHYEAALSLLGESFPRGRAETVARLLSAMLGQMLYEYLGLRPAGSRPTTAEAVRSWLEVCFLSNSLVMGLAAFRAQNLARRSASPREVCRSTAIAGLIWSLLPWHGPSEKYFREARRIAEHNSDHSSVAYVCMLHGYRCLTLGEFDRAVEILDHGQASAKATGDLRRREECLSLKCDIAIFRGHFAEARKLVDETLLLAQVRGDPQVQLWSHCDTARIHLFERRPESALAALLDARRFLDEGVVADRVMLAGLTAWARFDCGTPELAEPLAAEAIGFAGANDPFYAGHGLWGALHVLLRMSEASTAPTRDSALGKLIFLGVTRMRQLANDNPVLRPRALIAQARYARLNGSSGKATRMLEQAADAARQGGLRYELELASEARPNHAGVTDIVRL